ncbi:MAG: hypothetical protein SVT56_05350 [Chloroflexota bacterium]|nr:hypothetical protein [Chloroflexota bacterium]
MRETIEKLLKENQDINSVLDYFKEMNQYYEEGLLAMGLLDKQEAFTIESSADFDQRINYSDVLSGQYDYQIGDNK